ncbi:HET-domain-containing protein, partial [Tothia fuscella]
LPTRVIDISLVFAGQDPFLLESNGLQANYLALSHRWGGANVLRTTKVNIESHKQSIPIKFLSKTFIDAIYLAAYLGFSYLWIDSICIIQDSPEDWHRESTAMADIYRKAWLTISAACTSSSDTGLVQARPTAIDIKMPYRRDDDQIDGWYYLSTRDVKSFRVEVIEGHLNKRAWTMQERLLSNRVLHFGGTQCFWDCSSTIKEEKGIWNGRRHDFRFGDWTQRRSFLDPPFSNSDTPVDSNLSAEHSIWHRVIEQYTRRELTYPNDRLAAIAGLANAFANHNDDEYLAGLWRRDLPHGLLWAKGYKCEELQVPKTNLAPSWSWASMDGIIPYEPASKTSSCLDVLEVTMQTLGSSAFGRVEHGSMKLDGHLTSIATITQIRSPTTYVEEFYDDDKCIGSGSFDTTQ